MAGHTLKVDYVRSIVQERLDAARARDAAAVAEHKDDEKTVTKHWRGYLQNLLGLSDDELWAHVKDRSYRDPFVPKFKRPDTSLSCPTLEAPKIEADLRYLDGLSKDTMTVGETSRFWDYFKAEYRSAC